MGAANGLGLNRTRQAIDVLQKAFDLIDEWTRNDGQGVRSRLYFVSVGRELGELLRVRHPERALAVYDHALLRLSTVLDNAEARRGQAVLLAGSAYALRGIGRTNEAGRRIDAAFRVLAEAGEDAATHVPEHHCRVLAPGARGSPRRRRATRRAVEIYEELLDRLEASELDARA